MQLFWKQAWFGDQPLKVKQLPYDSAMYPKELKTEVLIEKLLHYS